MRFANAVSVVLVDLIVDVIELRAFDYVNDYVNGHDFPGRAGGADLLALQGEGLGRYAPRRCIAATWRRHVGKAIRRAPRQRRQLSVLVPR